MSKYRLPTASPISGSIPPLLLPDGQLLDFTCPRIMGILNITPDSFSDGGCFEDVDRAVEHALIMASDGADVIDIGGESTRPGAAAVPADEQIRRIEPVLTILRPRLAQAHPRVRISIDTSSAEVVHALIRIGIDMVNDVTAGHGDPAMLSVVAQHGLPIVLMHMRGRPRDMQQDPRYDDVVTQVRDFLAQSMERAAKAGIDPRRIMIDPGIGFGKTLEHNWRLLGGLDQLVSLRAPLLLGVSRKRFLASLCGAAGAELDGPTAHITALGVMRGVAMFRVHDVK
ncbi:MAG: dihydropteroate synthase, partial [Phycisphaeraceae bacterium]|nr:dihydropteroate synthase [Phycisphaeraceae bacterium]